MVELIGYLDQELIIEPDKTLIGQFLECIRIQVISFNNCQFGTDSALEEDDTG